MDESIVSCLSFEFSEDIVNFSVNTGSKDYAMKIRFSGMSKDGGKLRIIGIRCNYLSIFSNIY